MRGARWLTCAKSRLHRGFHEVATERLSLKFVAFHVSKIENLDFQFIKGFDKGIFPLSPRSEPPSALRRSRGSTPCRPAEYVNKC